MSSILIVDDEELVRGAILETIDFAKIGFHQVWEAEDGELAYDIVCERHPDIVMTDIRMPFMDGLELAEKIKENFPNTKIIILTGHDEFEYAKKALKLGVSDYIVKPIKPNELTELLYASALSLEEERSARLEQTKIKRQLRESLPLMQERALNALLAGDTEGLAQKLQNADLDILKKQSYCLAAVEAQLRNPEVMRIEISRLIPDHCILFADAQHRQMLLFVEECDEQTIAEILGNIVDRLTAKGVENCRCGFSQVVDDITKLKDAYEECLSAIGQGVTKTSGVFRYDAMISRTSFVYPKEEVLSVLNAVELNLPYALPLSTLHETLANQQGVTLSELRLVFADVINGIHKILLNFKCEIPEELRKLETPHFKLLNLDDMQEKLNETLSTVSELLADNKISRKKMIVAGAKQYIQNNFENADLSLNMVAKEVFVSPSYLSMLFKRETEESFVDYLTAVRMEAAKQIIRNNDLKTYEVALKVGYRDPHYFGVSFKKYTGSTPSEYKKLEA